MAREITDAGSVRDGRENRRVLLVDDNRKVRESIRGLLKEEPDMQVVGEAEDGQTGVQLARRLRPDVVVVDVVMPGVGGIEATRQIKAESPEIKILALSLYTDRRLVSAMLRAGAAGYLLKDHAFAELAQAIRAVAANRVYLSPEIAEFAVQGDGTRGDAQGHTPE